MRYCRLILCLLFDIIIYEVVCFEDRYERNRHRDGVQPELLPRRQDSGEEGQGCHIQEQSPKLLVIELDKEPQIEMTEDEKLEFVAARILKEHRAAFEELAK